VKLAYIKDFGFAINNVGSTADFLSGRVIQNYRCLGSRHIIITWGGAGDPVPSVPKGIDCCTVNSSASIPSDASINSSPALSKVKALFCPHSQAVHQLRQQFAQNDFT